MLLAIDVGNTNITLGLYDGDTLGPRWRIATDHSSMPDEYGLQFSAMFSHAGVPVESLVSTLLEFYPPLVKYP